MIKPNKLKYGDTIGIISPCIALKPEYIENSIKNLEAKGFKTKLSKNLFKDTYGYAASPEERAEDFNDMIADSEIKMILFGGGEVCNEILHLINYDSVKLNPKIICSYSDSTTILNAVTAISELVTFYGVSLRTFDNITEYNFHNFCEKLINASTEHVNASKWQIVHSGIGTGKLIGGYLANFAIMLGGKYLSYDNNDRYILLIEDHIKFSSPPVVSKYFSHIEQSGFFEKVSGLIIGHYSMDTYPQILEILNRLGKKYNIPIVKNDDFGHGVNNALFPLGITATLDADNSVLKLNESAVI